MGRNSKDMSRESQLGKFEGDRAKQSTMNRATNLNRTVYALHLTLTSVPLNKHLYVEQPDGQGNCEVKLKTN
jgi:hypothetical protein